MLGTLTWTRSSSTPPIHIPYFINVRDYNMDKGIFTPPIHIPYFINVRNYNMDKGSFEYIRVSYILKKNDGLSATRGWLGVDGIGIQVGGSPVQIKVSKLKIKVLIHVIVFPGY